MSSLRYNVESVVAEILGAQSALAGLDIKHFVADETPAKNRLVIKAEEPETEIPDSQARTAKIWRVPVTITIHIPIRARAQVTIGGEVITIGGQDITIGGSTSAAILDALGAAILAAMEAAAPAAAVALATNLFPLGIEVHPTAETEVGSEGTKLRTLTRSLVAFVAAGTASTGPELEFLSGDAFEFLNGETFNLIAA